MTNNYQRTANWLAACGKTKTSTNVSVQIGCHLEEMAELLSALEFSRPLDAYEIASAIKALETLAADVKAGSCKATIRNRAAALDALCDCEVTGNGVAYLANMDKPSADEAVLASNEAKLVGGKPVILDGGKIGKPPGWKAPDMNKFVWNVMSNE
mgnify:CR=1 FL=1